MPLYEASLIKRLTLQEVLRRFGPAPVEVALEIGRQACRELQDLHRQRMIHGEVSPDKVLLTRDGNGWPSIKLAPPGLIASADPRYASPEQTGTELIDERSDIYSLGVVLQELLGGPEQIPDDLRAVLLRAAAQDPEQRFADAEELCRSLESLQERYPLTGDELDPLFADQLAGEPEAEAAPAVPGTADAVPEAVDAAGAALLLDRSPLDEITWHSRPAPEDDLPAWEPLEEEEVEEAPVARPAWRRTSMLPAALPIGVMLVLALFMFLKGRPWWNPQVGEPEVPPMAAPPPAAPVRDAEPEPRPEIAEVAPPAVPAPAPAPRPAHPPKAEPKTTEPKTTGKRIVAEPKAEPKAARRRTETAPKPARNLPDLKRRDRLDQKLARQAPAPARSPRQRDEKPARRTTEAARIAELPRQRPEPRPAAPRSTLRPGPVVPVSRGPMKRGDLIHPGPGVSVPVPLDMPRFVYPAAARGRAGDVDVRLDLLVDERGKVIDAVVREGGPAELGFEKIALAAARRVPFQPATRNDIPGKMWTEMIFEFADPSARP